MTKISSLTALTGAGTDTAADLVPVVDMSEAGAARNKKQTYAEFLLALKEGIQDIVGAMALEGTNVTLNYDDAANTLTINATSPVPGDISGLNEAIDDRVAALLVAGSGITKSYNDGAGTLTLTATAPTGGMVYKGVIDCSANPNYPAALSGESYTVSVAGKIGGASGETVDVGDLIIASADNAGGTEASVGTSWFVLEHNLLSAISGSLASTTEQLTGTDAAKLATPDSVAALWEKGSDVASSGTISLGEGGYFNVTGTTTITDIDFATDKAGRKAWVKFAGVLTLTHNSSTLILPTGANITTAAGDTACFVSEGSDVVRCVAYQRASGAALAGSATFATASDINTGTDTTKALNSDALAGSNFGKAVITLLVSDPAGSAITTGDGKAYWRVPSALNGMNLISVAAAVTTVSSSGIPTVQIANVTDAVDMLSTKLTIDASETDSSTAAAAAVIDATKDDVATGDMLRIDIDVAGTGAKGLMVEMQFQLP